MFTAALFGGLLTARRVPCRRAVNGDRMNRRRRLTSGGEPPFSRPVGDCPRGASPRESRGQIAGSNLGMRRRIEQGVVLSMIRSAVSREMGSRQGAAGRVRCPSSRPPTDPFDPFVQSFEGTPGVAVPRRRDSQTHFAPMQGASFNLVMVPVHVPAASIAAQRVQSGLDEGRSSGLSSSNVSRWPLRWRHREVFLPQAQGRSHSALRPRARAAGPSIVAARARATSRVQNTGAAGRLLEDLAPPWTPSSSQARSAVSRNSFRSRSDRKRPLHLPHSRKVSSWAGQVSSNTTSRSSWGWPFARASSPHRLHRDLQTSIVFLR